MTNRALITALQSRYRATQAEIAGWLGVTPTALRHWIRMKGGARYPMPEPARRLALVALRRPDVADELADFAQAERPTGSDSETRPTSCTDHLPMPTDPVSGRAR